MALIQRPRPQLVSSNGEPAAPKTGGEGAGSGTLTLDEEHRLSRQWHTSENQQALATLIQAHIGLVVRIATEFRHSGPSLEDLIQEGCLGLTIAARRFDTAKATRLATYATYWIRACMMEHVVRSHGPVRIGTTRSQRKIFFGLGRARRRLEREGRATSCEALAHLLGVERQDVESMIPRLSSWDQSLDATRGPDDERSVASVLSDNLPTPEERVAGIEEDRSRQSSLREGLDGLDPRERAIILLRHMSARPATLASLGKRLRVSRERVRQLELRAIAKLRSRCAAPAGVYAAVG